MAAIRPEWNWQEPCDPSSLASDPPLQQANVEGLYNRAVLVVAERSPYTEGLETELKGLAQLDEGTYAQTALGQWLSNTMPQRSIVPVQALVEVLPLNSEQRQAVQQALANPITIITGPPGTGKSQVVADILINAAWQGKRVLFASKNNKAVDVVEARINNLGPRPILLRVGSNKYQTKLAEYLLGLLAATEEDQRDYDEALATQMELEKQNVLPVKKADEVIALRNRLDEIERHVEDARDTQNLKEKENAGVTAMAREFGPEYPKVANPEQVSDWEKLLYRALYLAGIHTIPQYQIEKYVLDLALVIDDKTRLDIEVDGERYHRSWDGELCRRDQMRNQRLYELGWDVMRFWVYEIRDDLAGCTKKVLTWQNARRKQ